MSHYSDDSSRVRVDFFKPSGKWYTTESVKWTGPYKGTDEKTGKITLIHEAFAISLRDHFANTMLPGLDRWRLEEMTAVCLEPYHEHSHPLMMPVARAKQLLLEGSGYQPMKGLEE
jgi:hypothetical protein